MAKPQNRIARCTRHGCAEAFHWTGASGTWRRARQRVKRAARSFFAKHGHPPKPGKLKFEAF